MRDSTANITGYSMLAGVTIAREKRTYIITKTGREGICRNPSKSIGNKAPAVTAAGII